MKNSKSKSKLKRSIAVVARKPKPKRRSSRQLLYLGSRGFVRAVSQSTGRRVWETSLPETGYTLVSLVCERGGLFAGSAGHLFGLDPNRGEIEWRNGLQGLGYEHLTLAGSQQTSSDGLVLIEQTAADERARAQP